MTRRRWRSPSESRGDTVSSSVGRDQQWCSGSHSRGCMPHNTSVQRIRTTADRYHGGHLPCGVHDSIVGRRSASHDAYRRWPVRCTIGSSTPPSIVAPVGSQGPPRDRRSVPIVVRCRRNHGTAAVCDPRRGFDGRPVTRRSHRSLDPSADRMRHRGLPKATRRFGCLSVHSRFTTGVPMASSGRYR